MYGTMMRATTSPENRRTVGAMMGEGAGSTGSTR